MNAAVMQVHNPETGERALLITHCEGQPTRLLVENLLPGFKLGLHEVGDNALVEVAKRLRKMANWQIDKVYYRLAEPITLLPLGYELKAVNAPLFLQVAVNCVLKEQDLTKKTVEIKGV